MKLLAKETIDSWGNGTDIIFIKDKIYEFVPKDNKYTRSKGFIGYIEKDVEGYKRWLTKEFKELYFEEMEGVNNK